jgi:hypothetical protein
MRIRQSGAEEAEGGDKEEVTMRLKDVLFGLLPAWWGSNLRSDFPFSPYSTVTDLARLRGWSTSVPMKTAVW